MSDFMTKRTSIYLNPPLEAALKGADSISGRLGQVCDRYLEIVRRARIAQRFSEAEPKGDCPLQAAEEFGKTSLRKAPSAC
jgi:hypothetical protein